MNDVHCLLPQADPDQGEIVNSVHIDCPEG